MNAQTALFEAPEQQRFPAPRPFQDVAHRELRAGFLAGHRLQVLMAPTGAGKTFLALRICNEALARGKRALFICDRKTLINQTSAVADGYGMPTHGIIQAKNPRMAIWRPFQIASAQTLGLRGINDDYDVIVVDEAHTVMKAVVDFISASKAAVIGLSATPFTKGLGKIYGRVVNAATMDELTRQGILTPMRILSCVRPNMDGAETKGGEWTPGAAEERGMTLIGDVVLEWIKHARGLKTIVFGPTVTHCHELVRQFKAAGINAATFTGETPDGERAELLREYRKPDSSLRILVSVEALAKGFDVPDVGCVIDCRPLRKSLSTWIQMIGRGLRCSPGKEECVLIDCSGNVTRFADDFADVYFNGLATLDAGERLDKEIRKDGDDADKPARSCKSCGYTPCGRRCVKCGFEPIQKSLVDHAAGEAVEIDILRSATGTMYASSLRELYNMIATHERAKAETRGIGNPKGSTAHRYRELTGKWPASSFVYESVERTPPSKALKAKLQSMRIAYIKGRR